MEQSWEIIYFEKNTESYWPRTILSRSLLATKSNPFLYNILEISDVQDGHLIQSLTVPLMVSYPFPCKAAATESSGNKQLTKAIQWCGGWKHNKSNTELPLIACLSIKPIFCHGLSLDNLATFR